MATGNDVGALKLCSDSDGDFQPLASRLEYGSGDASRHTKRSGSGRGA